MCGEPLKLNFWLGEFRKGAGTKVLVKAKNPRVKITF